MQPLSCTSRSVVCTHRLPANALAWPLQCLQCRHKQRSVLVQAAKDTEFPGPAPAAGAGQNPGSLASKPAVSEDSSVPEETFYEGSGAQAELVLSLLLAATLIYIPLTIASVGKRLWIKYTFTNKRVVIVNTSPLFASTVEVAYKNIKEIRTAPRAFGLWGDMVIFLKDGSRLEIVGLENYAEIRRHIESCMYD